MTDNAALCDNATPCALIYSTKLTFGGPVTTELMLSHGPDGPLVVVSVRLLLKYTKTFDLLCLTDT